MSTENIKTETDSSPKPPTVDVGSLARGSASDGACQATPREELLRQLLDSCIPKNEREWCAAREIEELRNFVRDAAETCGDCGGTGVWHMMLDETDFGQPPGSNRRDCPTCATARKILSRYSPNAGDEPRAQREHP